MVLVSENHYSVTRINPRSVRDLIEDISLRAGCAYVYPYRSGSVWWVVWNDDNPVGFASASPWILDHSLSLCYHCADPKHESCPSWASLLTTFLIFAEEEQYARAYVMANSLPMTEALTRMGFNRVALNGCLEKLWERELTQTTNESE